MPHCERCEELEEQVRQLKELLVVPAEFPHTWRLTPTQTNILAHLLGRGTVSRESFLTVLYGNRAEYPESNNLDVQMTRLKARLREHMPHIKIESVRGVGFRLSPEHIAELRALYVHPKTEV